jgi:hypothetical protein
MPAACENALTRAHAQRHWTHHMTLTEIITELRELTGIHDLSLDPSTRACRLVFNGTEEVEFEEVGVPGSDTFFIHAIVGPLPRSAPAQAFADLLKAGLFGLETGKAQLGYDDVREEVVLFQRFDAQVTDLPALTSQLERFLEVLRQRKHKLSEGSQDPVDGAVPLDISRFVRG